MRLSGPRKDKVPVSVIDAPRDPGPRAAAQLGITDEKHPTYCPVETLTRKVPRKWPVTRFRSGNAGFCDFPIKLKFCCLNLGFCMKYD